MKVLLDSSGWIEYFTGGPLADRYASYFTARYSIITPTIVLYEVYKKIKRERGEETALALTGGGESRRSERIICGTHLSLRIGKLYDAGQKHIGRLYGICSDGFQVHCFPLR